NLAARVHIGNDGITVMTGKVECGQGARAEITQAAAEELRVPASAIRLIMADTKLAPNDGGTFGSFTTPSTIPAVRQGCAAARNVLTALAAKKWGIEPAAVELRDGKITESSAHRVLSYAELALDEEATRAFGGTVPPGVLLTPVTEWRVLG